MKFLVFSDDWGVHPSSCQHIFRVLAPDHETVWVNTVGEATPIHLSAEAVVEALPGGWHADASRAGSGTWCVVRRSESFS